MTFHQWNIWGFVDNQTKVKTNQGVAIIDQDGKWFLRKYEEGKKAYNMPIIFESDDCILFCSWLSSQEIKVA